MAAFLLPDHHLEVAIVYASNKLFGLGLGMESVLEHHQHLPVSMDSTRMQMMLR
jgi:hypothetical protein